MTQVTMTTPAFKVPVSRTGDGRFFLIASLLALLFTIALVFLTDFLKPFDPGGLIWLAIVLMLAYSVSLGPLLTRRHIPAFRRDELYNMIPPEPGYMFNPQKAHRAVLAHLKDELEGNSYHKLDENAARQYLQELLPWGHMPGLKAIETWSEPYLRDRDDACIRKGFHEWAKNLAPAQRMELYGYIQAHVETASHGAHTPAQRFAWAIWPAVLEVKTAYGFAQ